MIAVFFMPINVLWQVVISTEVTRCRLRALVYMIVEKISPRELILAATAFRGLIALSFMHVDLLDRELIFAESATARPTTDRLMSVNVLRWESIFTPLTDLQIIASLLMQLQLSHWVDSFAETTSTWLFALVCLVVMNIVRRELKSAESTPHGSLILIACQLVFVEVDERLFDTAEPTCLRSAVTAMWRGVLTLDTHFADWAIVIWQVT